MPPAARWGHLETRLRMQQECFYASSLASATASGSTVNIMRSKCMRIGCFRFAQAVGLMIWPLVEKHGVYEVRLENLFLYLITGVARQQM